MILFLACAADEPPVAEDDLETSGTTRDTTVETDGGPQDQAWACPSYSGWFEGTTSSFQNSLDDQQQSGQVLSWSNEVWAWNQQGPITTFTVRTVMELVAADFTTHQDNYNSMRCTSEGLFLESVESQYVSIGDDGSKYEGGTFVEYDPPMLEIPNDLKDGDSWQVDTMAIVGINETPLTLQYEVTAFGDRTVPAGTFDTLGITVISDNATNTNFVAKREGLIASSMGELLSYE